MSAVFPPWLPQGALLVVLGGCASSPTAGHDDAADGASDVSSEATGDEPADSRADGGGDSSGSTESGGPVTLVASEIELTAERLCDLDGDGLEDNAIAELGSPGAGLFAMLLTSAANAGITTGENRLIFHAPWIDDRATPEDDDALIIVFNGTDTDSPLDPADDFSGSEPFYAAPAYVDACGEPRSFFPGSRIEAGAITCSTSSEAVPLGSGLRGYGTQAWGTLSPGGEGGELVICMYYTVPDLGGSGGPDEGSSYLETFLAGGSAVGMPQIPGMTPDIDVDGDGLERFTLGDEGRIASCIDGDSTVVDGADCWMDPRFADGFSLTSRVTGVPAAYAGLEPDWDDRVEGECPSPPATSLWDPS